MGKNQADPKISRPTVADLQFSAHAVILILSAVNSLDITTLTEQIEKIATKLVVISE